MLFSSIVSVDDDEISSVVVSSSNKSSNCDVVVVSVDINVVDVNDGEGTVDVVEEVESC